MTFRTALSAALACGICVPAAAEVTGGELALTHSRFAEDDSLSQTSLEARAEIAFAPAYALQLDAALERFGGTQDWSQGIAAHGIYHFSGTSSVGVFGGYDPAERVEASYVGVEAKGDIRAVTLEGFALSADADVGSGTVMGLSGHTPVGLRGVVGASLAVGDFGDGGDLSRVAVDGTYEQTSQLKLTGEIGYGDASMAGGPDGDLFVGIGGKVDFGGNRGATFDRRGLSALIPGL